EYGLVGLTVVVFSLAAGTGIAAYVVGSVMRLPFASAPLPALLIAAAALAVTVAVGLGGTLASLSRSSVETLRSL
ncbi:hypothetical protein J8J40_27865, partial [Mycobacterium tuberculosis]|nr:hypothetical protein [Mycobacterium tuberculosis]MBP0650871.1 hypothetical protein [Mycobacterium tuberculosis]